MLSVSTGHIYYAKNQIFITLLYLCGLALAGGRLTPRLRVAKCVTGGEAYLCGLALGQNSSEKTSRGWQAVRDAITDNAGGLGFNLTDLGIEPQIPSTVSDVLNNYANWPLDTTYFFNTGIYGSSCSSWNINRIRLHLSVPDVYTSTTLSLTSFIRKEYQSVLQPHRKIKQRIALLKASIKVQYESTGDSKKVSSEVSIEKRRLARLAVSFLHMFCNRVDQM